MKERFISPRKLQYLQQFSDVDPTDSMKFLGQGAEHTVFTYTDNEVLKIPHTLFGQPRHSGTAVEHDYVLAQQYFGNVTQTEIIHNPPHRPYCLIQKRISPFEPVNNRNAKEISSQLEKMAEDNRRLFQEKGKFLLFLGGKGMKRVLKGLVDKNVQPVMENITVTRENNTIDLEITDFTLINVYDREQEQHIVAMLKSFLPALFFDFYNVQVKKHFGIDIK